MVAGWLVVVAGWLVVVAGWLVTVAGCWSRRAKKNTQISKDSTIILKFRKQNGTCLLNHGTVVIELTPSDNTTLSPF